MKFRWMVSEDDGATYTKLVEPCVTQPMFEWVGDRASGRAGKRLQIATSLSFIGPDFTYFKAWLDSSGFCGPVPVRFEIWCDGEWKAFWKGRFAAGGGSWDYTKCRFEVKPKEDDAYSCISDAMATKWNILAVGPVTANVVSLPSLEFIVCAWESGLPMCGMVDIDTYTPAQVWWPSFFPDQQLVVMWREYAITECVNEEPVVPSGSGWTLLSDDCETSGTAKYTRTPTISWIFGTPQHFLDGEGYPEPPPATCGNWVKLGAYNYGFTPPGEVPFYVCLNDAASTQITRARALDSVLDFFISKMACGLQGVRSDFFGINPVGDAPGYEAGINYVTGMPTQTEGILLVQKSDVIVPGASQPATKGDLSIKELLEILYTMFRVKWFVDQDGYLRIEHYKYFNSEVSIDITAMPADKVLEVMSHEDANNGTPVIERMSFDDALGLDFIGADIVYSGPCIADGTQQQVAEYSAMGIITDVALLLNDPSANSRKGFVILACSFNGTNYDTIIDMGALSGEYVSNAPASTANLQRDYWTWDRYLSVANVNREDTVFDGFLPTIEQAGITVLCQGCAVLDFDANGLVRTKLGQQHLGGVDAEIEKASLGANGHLRLTLRYSK